MNQSQMALLKAFNAQHTSQHVPLEEILGKYPDAVQDLKVLLESGFIRPYSNENYDPQSDILEQLKPGPKLTSKGVELLLRSRFLF